MTKAKTEKQAYRSYYYKKNRLELLKKKRYKYQLKKEIEKGRILDLSKKKIDF
jgi:hypothetical protein